MISKKLIKLLEDNHTQYEIIKHRTVYTAYDAAATIKVKLNQIAKSLLVKFSRPFEDGTKPYAIAIVPADKNLDLKKITKVISTHATELNKKLRTIKPEKGKKQIIDIYNKISKVEIPKEKVMKDKFKVKPGAMSAFGSLHKIPVIVDKALKGTSIFSSGSFSESVKMTVGDFIKLENAINGNFSVAKKDNKPKSKNKVKIKIKQPQVKKVTPKKKNKRNK